MSYSFGDSIGQVSNGDLSKEKFIDKFFSQHSRPGLSQCTE